MIGTTLGHFRIIGKLGEGGIVRIGLELMQRLGFHGAARDDVGGSS